MPETNAAGILYVFDRGDKVVRHIGVNDPHMLCPVVECTVYLQPDMNTATLVDGVASHLKIVHNFQAATALSFARRAVADHQGILRSRRRTDKKD